MATDWHTIWTIIMTLAGETFHTKSGKPFTYYVKSGRIHVNRTDYPISGPRNIRMALDRGLVKGPGELKKVRGPAYIWALLTDERVIIAAMNSIGNTGA